MDDDSNDSPKINRNIILKSKNIDSTKIKGFLNQVKNISNIDAKFLKSAKLLDEIVITAQKETEEEKRQEELNKRTNYGFPTK